MNIIDNKSYFSSVNNQINQYEKNYCNKNEISATRKILLENLSRTKTFIENSRSNHINEKNLIGTVLTNLDTLITKYSNEKKPLNQKNLVKVNLRLSRLLTIWDTNKINLAIPCEYQLNYNKIVFQKYQKTNKFLEETSKYLSDKNPIAFIYTHGQMGLSITQIIDSQFSKEIPLNLVECKVDISLHNPSKNEPHNSVLRTTADFIDHDIIHMTNYTDFKNWIKKYCGWELHSELKKLYDFSKKCNPQDSVTLQNAIFILFHEGSALLYGERIDLEYSSTSYEEHMAIIASILQSNENLIKLVKKAKAIMISDNNQFSDITSSYYKDILSDFEKVVGSVTDESGCPLFLSPRGENESDAERRIVIKNGYTAFWDAVLKLIPAS